MVIISPKSILGLTSVPKVRVPYKPRCDEQSWTETAGQTGNTTRNINRIFTLALNVGAKPNRYSLVIIKPERLLNKPKSDSYLAVLA